ncbi:hypothetical protein QJS10_CPA16g01237 [Acorus calamus]|uniref:Protein kinase domain-containing protein n=1 Tax=Acorus calamus TaxID=4465 RepID=A0AAV9CZU7_ACOCL|nr:hypothetical protein QJS10_CPA16g01237 [Acorus calamus]
MRGAEAQRVVVIQYASREVCSSAVKWAMDNLKLKPGDELTLLGVLHQVNTPSTFSVMPPGRMLGYKSRINNTNQKIIEEEVARMKKEYENSDEVLHIQELYDKRKVAFNLEVISASSPKKVALDAAKNWRATWIILDRQMKKDKKYFMENLSCGISRMKSNNTIENLKEPRGKIPTSNERMRGSITYSEMIPGSPEKIPNIAVTIEEDDDDLFSVDLSPRKPQISNKNSLYEEPGNDDEKHTPFDNADILYFPKSVSSERLSLPSVGSSSNLRKPEASSSSNFDEESHLQQGNDHLMATVREAINSESPNILSHSQIMSRKSNAIISEEQKQVQGGEQNSLQSESANKTYRGIFNNPKFPGCGNPRPKVRQRDFTYAELEIATNEGGFGSVYKGQLKDGQMIAVKQHKYASLQGEKEFKSEVHVLSKAQHENVVMLLGSCSEGSHRLLVYEFVSNGSLDMHLSNWRFWSCKTQHDNSDHPSENQVVGTIGYLAPEYAGSGKASTKTDVYSFGVVLLELITGRRTIDKINEQRGLVQWAVPLLEERKFPELIDSRIIDSPDVLQLLFIVHLTEKCLSKNPDRRPTMDKVVEALEGIMQGNPNDIIDYFSPARSSISSIQVGGDDSFSQESLGKGSSTIGSSTRSSLLTGFSTNTSSTGLLSISTGVERLPYNTVKAEKNQTAKSRSHLQVLYNEMLN